MSLIELLIIASGLAMDAFAVAVCRGLVLPDVNMRHLTLTGLWFGGFQALMPLIGYCFGVTFADFVNEIDHWIALFLLGIIGLNMIKDAFTKDESKGMEADYSLRVMFALALATSIDALAVGVSFAFLHVNIWNAVIIIGLVTAALSCIGLYVGRYFGGKYRSKAEFAGGFILIMMGLSIFLEHTLP